MSRRKVAYAKKNAIDPEEEGEVAPFEPRHIDIRKDRWATSDYELTELLGRGKFGEVKKCKEKSSQLQLAAKLIAVHSESEKVDVRREIEIQTKLHHNRVLQLYDAFEKDRQMCIIMELVEGGELFDRVVDPTFDLTERVAILFMRQIVDAMSFIHSQHVIHLDMKPENVVCVAKTGTRIKIIDFGLALSYADGCSVRTMAGTLEFMAPEVANFDDVSPATDMWAVGVICYVLVSGLSPFLGTRDNDTTCNILTAKYDFDAEEFEDITDGCKDFITKLLVKDPRKRPSAADCMKHSWLQKITRAQTTRHLSKKFHMKYFARRKWKKAIRAIIAINRLEKYSVTFMTKKMSNTAIPDRTKLRTQLNTPDMSSDTKYDWRANMEARKKQREQERSTAHSKDKEQTSTVGRIPLIKKTDHSDNAAGASDTFRGGRIPLSNRADLSHSRRGDNISTSSRAGRRADLGPRLTDREQVNHSPSLSPRTQRRNRVTDNSSTPATRSGRLSAMSGRDV